MISCKKGRFPILFLAIVKSVFVCLFVFSYMLDNDFSQFPTNYGLAVLPKEVNLIVFKSLKPLSFGGSAGPQALVRFWPNNMVLDHMVWTIRTLWSWTINNLEEYSKSNMLQDHI